MQVTKGQAKIAVRSRVMTLLGEQLITDEVAAISELVKNAWDADAKKVRVKLFHVSEPDGYVLVKDNGHGMTREKVLSAWLELGTLSKTKTESTVVENTESEEAKIEKTQEPRMSESGKRVYLGEKGLGRLAVHKLGDITELVTRRENSYLETSVTLDWAKFESEGFLEDVPVTWEESPVKVFTKTSVKEDEDFQEHGTQIKITKLRRLWTHEMIKRVQLSLWAMKSPFAALPDFDIWTDIVDKEAPELHYEDISKLVSKATYSFEGDVNSDGTVSYRYDFERHDPELKRNIKKIAPPPIQFGTTKPRCGPFNVKFYAWDLTAVDIRAVFGDAAIYRESVRPNTGVKLFRDGFRVLPYGNIDDDWLGMDIGRVKQFELRLSRNQTLGVVEITSASNPRLLDKTDREGLIDNDEFRDFRILVRYALAQFEAERYPDRRKLKAETGRVKGAQRTRSLLTKNIAVLSKAVEKLPNLNKTITELKGQIKQTISEVRESLDSLLEEQEQPLLVAATIGLTYMMPTHEVRRDLREALRLTRQTAESMRSLDEKQTESVRRIVELLRQADSVVAGLGRLMQKSLEDQQIKLEKIAKEAEQLMHYRMERNKVHCDIEVRTPAIITGSDRLMVTVLLNLLDNSMYWVQMKPEHKIKIIIDAYQGGCILIVSDSGPGFQDDIETVTVPFFTRKPTGMGLGLYIVDRVAKRTGATLRLLNENDFPGLLAGASVALIFPGERK